MHIHGTSMNSPASQFAGAAAEKSAEAQSAAKTRKRLLRVAQSAQALEEDSVASLWHRAGHNLSGPLPGTQAQDTEKYPYNIGGRDPDLG